MTPERAKYLAKCSERERYIRMKLSTARLYLKWHKKSISNGGIRVTKPTAKYEKFELMAYRHELNRLKGMDRVVVIGDDEPFVNTLTGAEYWTCKCGAGIYVTDNYCSNCGKRILWEKVK